MSFEDLSSEDKQEVWSAIGATLGQYWSKVDVILDDAIKVSVDPRIVNELTALKGLTAGAGLAFGAIFAATDEFIVFMSLSVGGAIDEPVVKGWKE